MVIQIINLSPLDVFKKYSSEYKIFRDVYSLGFFGLEIRDITSALASLVQKIVLSEKEICYKRKKHNQIDLLISGTLNSFKELSRKIISHGDEDLGYRIVNVINNYEEYGFQSYRIGNKKLTFSTPLIMGILNVTPDSFSDGGKYIDKDFALAHALKMCEDGADIIDIGGESTRPGADTVSVEDEIDRTIPVIKSIKKENPHILISIDTTKSEVANKALESGASFVNDISAFTFDKNMLSVIKKYDAGLILMHTKGTPKEMQENPVYDDLISEIYDFLYKQILTAAKNGLNKIIVDPGIGFGKTVEHNFELLKRLSDFKSLGYPIMIGLSRKSFIGKTLNLKIDERDNPTAVLESLAVQNSARIIRTHNVKLAVQSAKLLKNFI
ncbi:MAG TPA: dihydropteroate synthase [Ignavibacteriaceae bacterium]|nr:dihydropteroate synthase [Ignavibacteriaceae bacterium]